MSTDNNLASQIQFIILCCKKEMNNNDINTIRAMVTDIKNLQEISILEEIPILEKLSMLAYTHGVYPLLYQTFLEYASDLIDQEMKDAMTYWFQSIKTTNEMMTKELIDLTKLLEEHDIAVLSFKGPLLAEMAYGDISFRQYRDLDILVHRDQVYEAGALLTNNNYVSEMSLTLFKQQEILDSHEDLALYSKNNPVMLEIHWQLFLKMHQIKFEAEEIWKSPYSCNIQNHQINTLQPELLLPYLCAHGSKHQWERIEWLVDIDRLIRSDIEMNWNKITYIAKQSHTMTQLLLGLSLANELFHTPMIKKIKDQFKEKKIISLKNQILLFLKEGIKPRHYFFHLHLQDSFQDKCLYTWYRFGRPSPYDIRRLTLPTYLSFIYYFIKFYRVLKILPRYVMKKIVQLKVKESDANAYIVRLKKVQSWLFPLFFVLFLFLLYYILFD
jgi:hypothetical protein